ncbi:hypothetical protein BJY04DRAFT_61432 [Aspergillus karnatakaensis]|uniref:uncharacterized protein n=1 Tax=Aspergillus karnatakaensis TaxID=1810916 RepID=UPI003CCD7B6A
MQGRPLLESNCWHGVPTCTAFANRYMLNLFLFRINTTLWRFPKAKAGLPTCLRHFKDYPCRLGDITNPRVNIQGFSIVKRLLQSKPVLISLSDADSPAPLSFDRNRKQTLHLQDPSLALETYRLLGFAMQITALQRTSRIHHPGPRPRRHVQPDRPTTEEISMSEI